VKRRLLVRVDGELLADEEARLLWERFSAHMETNRGDLGGFAAAEGLASVHPGIEDGQPVLLASRSAPQGPYTSVASGEPGGAKGGAAARSKKPGKPSPSRSGGGSGRSQDGKSTAPNRRGKLK